MIDAAAYILVLFEQFSDGGDAPDRIWRTRHRWDDVIFNSPLSYHADPNMVLEDGTEQPLNPFVIEKGILSIVPRPIPKHKVPDVTRFLEGLGKYTPEQIADVTHYTGLISLHDSWAETYGYFEIRARVPGYRGHWPAFWLAPGTKGWPPEIDVFEIDMRDHNTPPIKDFKATVHFDAIDPTGAPFDDPIVANPYNEMRDRLGSRLPEMPVRRGSEDKPRWTLGKTIYTGHDLTADFFVYGLEWTPSHIVWYFGSSAETLKEVYRTPTPPDLHSALYVIANTEIGGLLSGASHADDIVSDQFDIDYIKVFARRPEHEVIGGGKLVGTDSADHLVGGNGSDTFWPEGGLDLVEMGGGADEVYLAREHGNAIIEGFGPDDTLWLSGFHRSPETLFRQALEVGSDLWLRDPGYPFEPRTIILRDVTKSRLKAEQFLPFQSD